MYGQPLTVKSGSTYGKWTVVSNSKSGLRVLCRCACGTERMVNIYNLTGGKSTSCGCGAEYGKGVRTHGLSRTHEYQIWKAMKARCYNPGHKNYAEYGGRGVVVCERWRESVENFVADMGRRPSPAHSIDRIDCNGNYEPSNCRWATQQEQTRNMRRSNILEYGGRALTVAEWAVELGVGESTLYHRLYAGWSAERAIETPVRALTRRG